MMKREEGLEIVKKEERRRKSKTKEKEWQHVVENSRVDCRKECCWSDQFLPCLCSNAGMESHSPRAYFWVHGSTHKFT